MNAIHQKTIIALLVSIIALSAANSGVALTASCGIESCCCSKANAAQSHFAGHDLMQLGHNCEPIATAPCCDLKPVQSKTALAISSRPKIIVHHAVRMISPTNEAIPETKHIVYASTHLEVDRIRAPQAPIYLLTLSILC